jgi:F-type H+-transporting ATPase subunit a
VTPIEFVSVFLVRPFSLAVRLFANLLAGHILVATFARADRGARRAEWYAVDRSPAAVRSCWCSSFCFEVLVSVLQAYIFTILAAVYIGGSMHPEH